jgi:hypothetical protein
MMCFFTLCSCWVSLVVVLVVVVVVVVIAVVVIVTIVVALNSPPALILFVLVCLGSMCLGNVAQHRRHCQQRRDEVRNQ